MPTLHRHTDPADFLAHAESFLLAAESENVLMLGICMQLASGGQSPDSCYLATVDSGGTVVACALRTPPFSAVVTRAGRPALDLLVTDLLAEYPDLPTAVGPEPSITAFAELWSERTGGAARPHVHMRLFEARQVLPPPRPGGTCRVATEADLPTVARWVEAFFDEVGLHDPSDPAEVVREQIEEGSLRLWCDERPVSMAAWAGRTGRTLRINFVYTPPEHRGRGYASACVASLTQALLDEGLHSCCLYADLANPTSNKIYQAVGYRPICDVTEFRLVAGCHDYAARRTPAGSDDRPVLAERKSLTGDS
ncbi:MAG TPA: GNAT family N-acetyltransferase [Thermoleophilia bacterium]|nr:GNAT family N-acetyltransferase [Thermoleophilia bacterium]